MCETCIVNWFCFFGLKKWQQFTRYSVESHFLYYSATGFIRLSDHKYLHPSKRTWKNDPFATAILSPVCQLTLRSGLFRPMSKFAGHEISLWTVIINITGSNALEVTKVCKPMACCWNLNFELDKTHTCRTPDLLLILLGYWQLYAQTRV